MMLTRKRCPFFIAPQNVYEMFISPPHIFMLCFVSWLYAETRKKKEVTKVEVYPGYYGRCD